VTPLREKFPELFTAAECVPTYVWACRLDCGYPLYITGVTVDFRYYIFKNLETPHTHTLAHIHTNARAPFSGEIFPLWFGFDLRNNLPIEFRYFYTPNGMDVMNFFRAWSSPFGFVDSWWVVTPKSSFRSIRSLSVPMDGRKTFSAGSVLDTGNFAGFRLFSAVRPRKKLPEFFATEEFATKTHMSLPTRSWRAVVYNN